MKEAFNPRVCGSIEDDPNDAANLTDIEGCHAPKNNNKPIRVLMLHGTADPVVPIEGGDIATWWDNGARGQVYGVDKTAAFWENHSMEVKLRKLDGAGHIWPGGDTNAPGAKNLGNAFPMNPNGGEEIWDFFADQ